MKKIAIIPARYGSKRIPNKNIKEFHGKPIIAYAIQCAQSSGIYDEIMVSTDNEIIAKIATEYGASVPFYRSDKNSDDHATTFDVINEVVSWYKKKKIEFEYASCIYACSPFITTGLLKQSFDILHNKNCDCVFPITKYSHPIQRAFRLSDSKKISPIYDINSLRTQDLESTFHDAGMFYSFHVEKIMINKTLHPNNSIGIEIDELKSQDIDTESDWVLAEIKYNLHSFE